MSADRARRRSASWAPQPPAWALEALGEDPSEELIGAGDALRITASKRFALLRASIAGAARLAEPALQRAVEELYGVLRSALGERDLHALRFWNYVPGIGGTSQPAPAYEAFNVGRYGAFRRWFDGDDFGGRLAAASCVDPGGDDLVVHALAASAPATPVENPRQTPSYRYSRRYGLLPPCFARAVALAAPLPGHEGERSAIVSGTASIVGEDTRHESRVDDQLAETLRNLALLAGALTPDDGLAREEELLAHYRDLRAYVARPQDASAVADRLARAFPGLARPELVEADLCRPGLLVEVEGTLTWDGPPSRPTLRT